MNNCAQHVGSFQEGVASFSHSDLKHTFGKARENILLYVCGLSRKLLSQERKAVSNCCHPTLLSTPQVLIKVMQLLYKVLLVC